MRLRQHPIGRLLPEMTPEEYAHLRDDIRRHGLREPFRGQSQLAAALLAGTSLRASLSPDRAALNPIGEATVALNTGDLRLQHQLDFDQSPGTDVGGNPMLHYNSSTVNVRPIIAPSAASSTRTPTSSRCRGTLTPRANCSTSWTRTA